MDILLYRQMKRHIVEICDDIYMQKWNKVDEEWRVLKPDLMASIHKMGREYNAIEECDKCINRKNYLRFHDCLIYQIDLFITTCLLNLGERERKEYAYKARKENENALVSYHHDLLWLLSKKFLYQNLQCTYEGTENVSISIREDNNWFRLFSSINPWLESRNMISVNVRESFIPDEIHVLGAGGGHLVHELGRKYPETRIKVYIPNANVFQMVLLNIPLKEVLINERIEILYDPLCLDFSKTLKHKKTSNKFEKYIFYINRQEIRASYKGMRAADSFLSKYVYWSERGDTESGFYSNIDSCEAGVGRKIYNYIKECL